MSASATDRLSRLLAMVPWLLRRQGIALAEAARHFGIGEDQLVKDLQLLFVCGTPGHYPDDLIAADWESGHVYLSNADEIARPVRLSVDEAAVLLASLNALAEVPGLHERATVDSVAAKIAHACSATHDAPVISAQLATSGTVPDDPDRHDGTVLAAVRRAVSAGRALRLTYLVAARDETTVREVDPWRLVTADGAWYLDAWCHRAGERRSFRLDRIVQVDDLGREVTVRRGQGEPEPVDPAPGRVPERRRAVLALRRDARWVVEYYPVTVLGDLPDGGLQVELPYVDDQWLARFVLPLGGSVRVVSPEGVAARTADLAAAALAAYPGR